MADDKTPKAGEDEWIVPPPAKSSADEWIVPKQAAPGQGGEDWIVPPPSTSPALTFMDLVKRDILHTQQLVADGQALLDKGAALVSVGIEETRDGFKAAVEFATMRKFDDLVADTKQDIKDGVAKIREIGGDLKESFDGAAARGRKSMGIEPAQEHKGTEGPKAGTKKQPAAGCAK